MPPWKPEPGFGDFVGERHLSDVQIQTIARWVAGGRLEGDRADLPSAPAPHSGWQLGPPDLVVTLPEYTLRADGADLFRNFVVTVPGSGTRFVRGLEFRPGGRGVHHANIRVDRTPASRRLDEADPEPGYEGMILRSADYPDGHFLGWTPGQAPPPGPNDLAWQLDAGDDLVVQVHLQPTGKPERIRPSIGLYFANAAARTHAFHRSARTPEPRHSSRRRRLPRHRRVRPAGGCRDPRDPAARALSRAQRPRVRGAPRRRTPAAHRDPPLGLQLAGSVPVRLALLGACRYDPRDGIRVRQLGDEREEPEPSAGAGLVGLAHVG